MAGFALGGYFVGRGAEEAGKSIGNGIERGAKQLADAADLASSRAALAMLDSSARLAAAGLEATDLATKRLSLALLQSVASLSDRADTIVREATERFTTSNEKMLGDTLASLEDISRRRLQEFDAITARRSIELTSALRRVLATVEQQSLAWQDTAHLALQQLESTARTIALLQSLFCFAGSMLITVGLPLLLVGEPAFQRLVATAGVLLPAVVAIILVAVSWRLAHFWAVRQARAKADEALQWAYVQAKLAYLAQELKAIEGE
jgi:hypothetical protein